MRALNNFILFSGTASCPPQSICAYRFCPRATIFCGIGPAKCGDYPWYCCCKYWVGTRENDGTEREAQGLGRDMSCPRKLFLTQRKSRFSSGSLFSETSACSLASLSGSQWHFVRHYMKSLLFFQTSDRGWPACGRLGRQTSTTTKTSARLKITFVDMTYPKGWTESLPLCPLIFSWFEIISVWY